MGTPFKYISHTIISCIIFVVCLNGIIIFNRIFSEQINTLLGINGFLGKLSFVLIGIFLGSYIVYWQRFFILGNDKKNKLPLQQWLFRSVKIFFYLILTLIFFAIGKAVISMILIFFSNIFEQSSNNVIVAINGFVALAFIAIICFILSTISLTLIRTSIGEHHIKGLHPYDFSKAGRLQLSIVFFYITLKFFLTIGIFFYVLNTVISDIIFLAAYQNEIYIIFGLFIVGFFIILFMSAHCVAFINRRNLLRS